jgi:hypothetical protein
VQTAGEPGLFHFLTFGTNSLCAFFYSKSEQNIGSRVMSMLGAMGVHRQLEYFLR